MSQSIVLCSVSIRKIREICGHFTLGSGFAGRWVSQPVPRGGPGHRPQFFVHFVLIPPRRVPSERDILIDRHQLAAVEDGCRPGECFTYCVELDRGTEPVRRFSSDDESCERKIRIYDQHRAVSHPYFVLFLAPTWERITRILSVTAARSPAAPRLRRSCRRTILCLIAASERTETSPFLCCRLT